MISCFRLKRFLSASSDVSVALLARPLAVSSTSDQNKALGGRESPTKSCVALRRNVTWRDVTWRSWSSPFFEGELTTPVMLMMLMIFSWDNWWISGLSTINGVFFFFLDIMVNVDDTWWYCDGRMLSDVFCRILVQWSFVGLWHVDHGSWFTMVYHGFMMFHATSKSSKSNF